MYLDNGHRAGKSYWTYTSIINNLKIGIKVAVLSLDPDKYKRSFKDSTGIAIELTKTEKKNIYMVSFEAEDTLVVSPGVRGENNF